MDIVNTRFSYPKSKGTQSTPSHTTFTQVINRLWFFFIVVQRHCTIQCGELNLTHYLNLSCSIRLTQSEGTYTLFFCLNNFWTIFVYVFKNCTLHHPNPNLLSSGRCGGYKMLRFCGFCLIFPCHLFNNIMVQSVKH